MAHGRPRPQEVSVSAFRVSGEEEEEEGRDLRDWQPEARSTGTGPGHPGPYFPGNNAGRRGGLCFLNVPHVKNRPLKASLLYTKLKLRTVE
jgi:hypothetical protein